MAKEQFKELKSISGNFNVACKYDDGTVRYWNESKKLTIQRIISIVIKYAKLGYNLSLRQLHYQMVSNNWIVNHQTAYKKLGTILDECRYGGLIDWDAIVDRGRQPYIQYYVKDIPDALEDTIRQYKLDRMKGQESVIEVWTEKDALSEILRTSTEKYHVRLIVNKGYTSSSAAYTAYQRILKAFKAGKSFDILYVGDHDPSGLDMIRDIRERLCYFLAYGTHIVHSDDFEEWWIDKYDDNDLNFIDQMDREKSAKYERRWNGDSNDSLEADWNAERVYKFIEDTNLLNVVPVCLTYDQVKQYRLPENPTKMTDTRSDGYIKKFGKKCWEVDALEPTVLTELIESNIEQRIQIGLYNDILRKEDDDKEILREEVDRFRGENPEPDEEDDDE